MDLAAERTRLSQQHVLNSLRREPRLGELITAYSFEQQPSHYHYEYSAFVPTSGLGSTLEGVDWEIGPEECVPTTGFRDRGNGLQPDYSRFGNAAGIEPLVIFRDFHGVRPDYLELSEEFRLFHELYHDRKTDCFYSINRAGNEDLVARIRERRVEVRLREILQFAAIKDMHFATMFDLREHSILTLDELQLVKEWSEHEEGLARWGFGYADFGGGLEEKSFSRLLGKQLIPPVPKSETGKYGFTTEKKVNVDFIIGVDGMGDVLNTSAPERIAKCAVLKSGSVFYLTPVHFRKQVLDKYYQQPSKYSIRDGYLSCGHLWGLTIDNHHEDRIVVWLGDLHRDLPYEEQLHWRSQNIPPSGSVSSTFFRRQIMSEFTDSPRPEHVFHSCYESLVLTSVESMGWPILLPLGADDEHYLRSLRVPASDEQKAFDELVQALAKILIDSLNEKSLIARIPVDVAAETKGGISCLEVVLHHNKIVGADGHIAFLRKLQRLRSSGAAHRKGKNYEKAMREVGLDQTSIRSVSETLLRESVSYLKFLCSIVRERGI